MRLVILLLLLICCLPFSSAAPPTADPATVQQLREDIIRQQERLDATRRDLDRQRQDQTEMEARVKALLADREKGQEEAQKRQDDRIADIGQGAGRLEAYVALASLLITVGGAALGVAGWFKIKSYAEKQAQDAATKLKELAEHQTTAIAQMEKRSQDHLDHMDRLHDQATAKSKEYTDLINRVTASAAEQGGAPLSAADQAELSAAALKVDETPKPDRTPADWLVLGNKALTDKDYGGALTHFDKALTHPAASNLERAQALNGRGVTLGRQGLHADVATTYDLAFQFACVEESSEGRTQSARALYNKGAVVGRTDGTAAIAIYDDVVRRYGDDSQPEVRERVARSLFNKGGAVGKTNSAAAIAIYDDVISRYGDDSEPKLREPVARALFNKGVEVSKTDPTTAITQLENMLAKYADDPALKSLTDKAKAQITKLRKKLN